MRKPTLQQFVAIELAIWFSFIGYLIATYDGSWSAMLFMKIGLVNIGVALFNTVSTCISMATGWWPWQEM